MRSLLSIMLRMRGLTAPVFTPLSSDGNVDPDRISKYAQHLAAQNVSNIFVTGTSGEFPSLTLDERKTIQKEWIKQGKKHLSGNVIVHIGGTAVADVQDLAKHAVEHGADAVASVIPYYLVPTSVDVMIEYFKEITKAVPETPFLYYHFPTLTKCNVNLIDFVAASVKEIPNFVGMKYTDDNMEQLGTLQDRFGDQIQLFNGFDFLNLEAMKLGVSDGICATYSLMPGAHHRMREAFQQGDMLAANKEAEFVSEVFRVMNEHSRHGLTAGLKDTARAAGLDIGMCRLPLKSCTDETINNIRKGLESIDFFVRRY